MSTLPTLTLELLDLIQSDRPAALTDNPADVPRIAKLLRDVRALAQRECAFERVNDNQGKKNMKNKYTVRRYSDNEGLGSVELTAEQFRKYEAIAQQPEGVVRLGSMPHDIYNLDVEFQDESPETTIYLE